MGRISEIATRITLGERSARQEIEEAFERSERYQAHHALLQLTKERALERAADIDSRLEKGESVGALAGVPFAVKDNILAFGAPTTAGSHILEQFYSPLQATAVEKLEHEGAICIGKTNLDAFGHGASTENSAFGPTANAFNTSRVAGGSSGGSAVATALDIVPFALGTDTGGSIRQPASFNGVVGVKPTYGTVSRYGVIAMASSTDTVGCLTRDVADAEQIMTIISGRDVRDMTTVPDFFVPQKAARQAQKIGLLKETMEDHTDSDVRRCIREYADRLEQAGHIVEEVSMPMLKYALAIYYITVPAEISSNLARYDGIRYGHRACEAKTLAELYGRSRDEGFVTENKRRIMIGSYVLSSGYFDAYYLQAQKARTLLVNEYALLFDTYDALLSPVAPTPAFALGKNTSDPVNMYLEDIMTVPPSLAGLPAISVPAGVSGDGLPVGAQLIGKHKSDAALLGLAKSLGG